MLSRERGGKEREVLDFWKKGGLTFEEKRAEKEKLRKKSKKKRERVLERKPRGRGWIKLWILDFLKERRVFLHSKELYINPSPLRAKLEA